MELRRRDIFLKIEPLLSYSPLAPIVCSRRYGRDCMYTTLGTNTAGWERTKFSPLPWTR
jgi:hypothetical protein